METAGPSNREVDQARTQVEKKWRANAEKVAFAKGFPGRLTDWAAAEGKTVERVLSIGAARALLFSDGTFLIVAASEPEPAVLIAALLAARPLLERHHPKGYETLDRHISTDRELQRRARLENIMGAIRNNLPQIPELKEALRRFVRELEDREDKEG
ncbi:MAG: hypothetical protein HY282_18325 [Nitrospirae bacterium]|nr:hypothetical protein [Candidatus Manganitrophaceae bacterium]